jgi:hypothetical protein
MPPTINGTVTALRFFFSVTVDRSDVTKPLTFVAEPRKIPVILSPEEVVRFLEAAPGPKYKAALSAAYSATRLLWTRWSSRPCTNGWLAEIFSHLEIRPVSPHLHVSKVEFQSCDRTALVSWRHSFWFLLHFL